MRRGGDCPARSPTPPVMTVSPGTPSAPQSAASSFEGATINFERTGGRLSLTRTDRDGLPPGLAKGFSPWEAASSRRHTRGRQPSPRRRAFHCGTPPGPAQGFPLWKARGFPSKVKPGNPKIITESPSASVPSDGGTGRLRSAASSFDGTGRGGVGVSSGGTGAASGVARRGTMASFQAALDGSPDARLGVR